LLEGREYVPLLHARLAEIRALRELPDVSKNLLVPVFKLRPWLNSKTFDRAVEVVEEAVGNRLYGFDLDRTKYQTDPPPEKEAAVNFSGLFDSSNSYEQYYNLIEAGANRVPVFRDPALENPQIDGQLDRIEAIGRGFFVRVQPAQSGALMEIAQRTFDRNIDNPVFIIDCGWGRDILSSAALATTLAQNLIDISEEFEVVVAGSSFPDAFSDLGTRFSISAIERQLFKEVRRQINTGKLIYGDWGSTRPPTDPVPMRNVPRIDTALPTNWIGWRSSDGETYVQVANRTIVDSEWDGSLGIWGEYMILATAAEEEIRIKSPAMAAAVRVNLHLHQQANFDNPDGLHVGDQVVGDDL
jgi:hypothetical protein